MSARNPDIGAVRGRGEGEGGRRWARDRKAHALAHTRAHRERGGGVKGGCQLRVSLHIISKVKFRGQHFTQLFHDKVTANCVTESGRFLPRNGAGRPHLEAV